ncbi:TonB-dependent receptor [candidate division KSB1 bacterium]|nr:TonB-dependent receptor [candidate division KSB1 bacterium]
MPWVNVMISDTDWGAATNNAGYYIIQHVPPGEYTLIFSMMGYEKRQQQVRVAVNEAVKVDVTLNPAVIELEGVVKTAERERFEREVEISTNTLTAKQLSTMPMLAEADVFRTLQLLPGVVSRSDFSSQLYVRGGSPDENLVLLDGVAVYNPFHLLGLFSTFNTDAIKEVEFMTGGFPAEYGGRLSSVLSITNNEGNSKEFEGRANISMLSAKATLQGPFPHGSYLISARRTYFDQIFKGTRYDFPYYFYDFQGKINFNLGDNHRLTLSGFYGDDKLNYDLESDEEEEEFTVGIDWLWGNRTTALKWRWLIHPNLYSEVLLTRSNFTLDLDLDIVSTNVAALNVENGIVDRTIKADFNYFGIVDHGIKFGASQSWLDFKYAFGINGSQLFNYQAKPALVAAYAQDQWQLSNLTAVRAGARVEHYSIGAYTTFSPRVGFKHRLYDNFALKGSFGLYHQFMTTAASDNQNFSFVDLWFPLAEQYQPLNAVHYVAGFEWWLPADLIFTGEFYYKTMDNLLEINEYGDFANADDDFIVGDGHATGCELLLKRSTGRINGWIGYTFAFTQRQVNSIIFYPRHDRRHNLNLVMNCELGKGWNLGFVFTYGTGMPYTPVLGKYVRYSWNYHRNEVVDEIYNRLGSKNSQRYPTYHRMDLSIRKRWRIWGLENYPYVQIINAYNRKNVFLYFWDHDANPSQFITVPMFPFLPTIGMEINF